MNIAATEINRANECLLVAMERKSCLIGSLEELEGLHDQSPISLLVTPGAWENLKLYYGKLWKRDRLKHLIEKAATDYKSDLCTHETQNDPYPHNIYIGSHQDTLVLGHGRGVSDRVDTKYAALLREFILIDNEVKECQKCLSQASLDETSAFFEHVRKIKEHIIAEDGMISQIERFLIEQKEKYRLAMSRLEGISELIHDMENILN